jgi:hypothetical protein
MSDPEQIVFSHSNISCFRECPQKWRYRYLEKLRPRRTALPLRRGSLLHEALEEHYAGRKWLKPIKAYEKEYRTLTPEEKEEYGDLPGDARRIMEGYFRHWDDSDWEVVGTEVDAVVELADGMPFRLIIDLVFRAPDGSLWIMDHKTVANFQDTKYLFIEPQLPRYFWSTLRLTEEQHVELFGEVLDFERDLRGVIFNEISTTAPTPPEVLKSGELTRRKNLRCDPHTYRQAIKDNGLSEDDYEDVLSHLELTYGDKFFRRTILARDPVLTETTMVETLWTAHAIERAVTFAEFPRHVSRGCSWCDFFDPCTVELNGGDALETKRISFTRDNEEDW